MRTHTSTLVPYLAYTYSVKLHVYTSVCVWRSRPVCTGVCVLGEVGLCVLVSVCLEE